MRHTSLWPGVLETVYRIPRPQPRGGEDSCLKSYGGRIAAWDPDRQTAEIHIRVADINRFNALGVADVHRMS